MCGLKCYASLPAGAEGTCTPRALVPAASSFPTSGSYIWAHAGMETFSERLQRRWHRQSRGEDNSCPSSSRCTHPIEAENTTAGSSASKGKDPVKVEEDDLTPSTSQGTELVKKDENDASTASSSKGKATLTEEDGDTTTQVASRREGTKRRYPHYLMAPCFSILIRCFS